MSVSVSHLCPRARVVEMFRRAVGLSRLVWKQMEKLHARAAGQGGPAAAPCVASDVGDASVVPSDGAQQTRAAFHSVVCHFALSLGLSLLVQHPLSSYWKTAGKSSVGWLAAADRQNFVAGGSDI